MFHRIKPHLPQFGLYLLSGGAAMLLDFGSYFLLLWMGTWYFAANVLSNALGFVGSFLLHKFFVFRKQGATLHHFCRYCLINIAVVAVQSVLLVILVEWLSVDVSTAKILSWFLSSLGNFFLYKFLVYV